MPTSYTLFQPHDGLAGWLHVPGKAYVSLSPTARALMRYDVIICRWASDVVVMTSGPA